MVVDKKREIGEKVGRKRKRHSAALNSTSDARSRSRTQRGSTPLLSSGSGDEMMRDVLLEDDVSKTPTSSKLRSEPAAYKPLNHDTQHLGAAESKEIEPPLKGVKVVVIHVKDSMADGPLVGDSILSELRAHEEKLKAAGKPLGCSFDVSCSGDMYLF